MPEAQPSLSSTKTAADAFGDPRIPQTAPAVAQATEGPSGAGQDVPCPHVLTSGALLCDSRCDGGLCKGQSNSDDCALFDR